MYSGGGEGECLVVWGKLKQYKEVMGKSRVGAIMVKMRMEGMIHADIWRKTIQEKNRKGSACWRNSKEADVYVAHKMRLEKE